MRDSEFTLTTVEKVLEKATVTAQCLDILRETKNTTSETFSRLSQEITWLRQEISDKEKALEMIAEADEALYKIITEHEE